MKGSWQGKLGHVKKVHVSHAEGCDVHPGLGGQSSQASLRIRLPTAHWPPTVFLNALPASHLRLRPLSRSLRLCAIQPLLLQPRLLGATQPSPAPPASHVPLPETALLPTVSTLLFPLPRMPFLH